KQSARTLIRSCSEIHRCSRGGCRIVVAGVHIARTDRPDAIDRQRLPVSILEQPIKLSRSEIVGGNEATGLRISAASELSDKQVVTEASEIQRSQSDSPWSVQPVAMFQTL